MRSGLDARLSPAQKVSLATVRGRVPGVLILLFLQSHLAESRFPPTHFSHSLEVVTNSTDCSPKHTISPENGCGHVSVPNTITDTSQGWNPLPVAGRKRRLKSRLQLRPKWRNKARYKRERDTDSLCRETARELSFCHRLLIISDRCESNR